MGPGSAAHHFVLRSVRGTIAALYPFTSWRSEIFAGPALAPAMRT